MKACRAERAKAAQLQSALQRAQQHILDLQEQHATDLEEVRLSSAAELVSLRTRHCSLEQLLSQSRQAAFIAPTNDLSQSGGCAIISAFLYPQPCTTCCLDNYVCYTERCMYTVGTFAA